MKTRFFFVVFLLTLGGIGFFHALATDPYVSLQYYDAVNGKTSTLHQIGYNWWAFSSDGTSNQLSNTWAAAEEWWETNRPLEYLEFTPRGYIDLNTGNIFRVVNINGAGAYDMLVITNGIAGIRLAASGNRIELRNTSEMDIYAGILSIWGYIVIENGPIDLQDIGSIINPSDPTNGAMVADRDYNDLRYGVTNACSFSIVDSGDWNSQTIPLGFSPGRAITIRRIVDNIYGGTSLSYNLDVRSSAGTAGTEVFSADAVATTGVVLRTSFTNASCAANSIWMFTTGASAETGTVSGVILKIEWTYD